MRTIHRLLAALLLCAAGPLRAEEAAAPAAEALEAAFKTTLTDVTLSGRWTPLEAGVLGAEKEDAYHIVRVEKKEGSAWTIHARLKYGKLEMVLPIPVQVKWAGDTAVIIVDRLQMPGASLTGGPAYSARVLIHEHTYAGTWSGGDHGGLLSGVITSEKPAEPAKP